MSDAEVELEARARRVVRSPVSDVVLQGVQVRVGLVLSQIRVRRQVVEDALGVLVLQGCRLGEIESGVLHLEPHHPVRLKLLEAMSELEAAKSAAVSKYSDVVRPLYDRLGEALKDFDVLGSLQ